MIALALYNPQKDDHLDNDQFQITRKEFIDAHIDELIFLDKKFTNNRNIGLLRSN